MDQDQTQEQEVYGIAANNGGKPPVRLREPTPEGRAYNIVTISKLYNSLVGRIKRQSNYLIGLLDTNNHELILAQGTILDQQFAEADDHNKRLLELLESDLQTQQMSLHEEIDAIVFQTKDSVGKWMKDNEKASSRTGSQTSRSRSKKSDRTGSVKTKGSKGSKTSVVNLKVEVELLQHVQQTKQKEMEYRMLLEHAKMESEKAKLQQKLVRAQLEEENFKSCSEKDIKETLAPPIPSQYQKQSIANTTPSLSMHDQICLHPQSILKPNAPFPPMETNDNHPSLELDPNHPSNVTKHPLSFMKTDGVLNSQLPETAQGVSLVRSSPASYEVSQQASVDCRLRSGHLSALMVNHSLPTTESTSYSRLTGEFNNQRSPHNLQSTTRFSTRMQNPLGEQNLNLTTTQFHTTFASHDAPVYVSAPCSTTYYQQNKVNHGFPSQQRPTVDSQVDQFQTDVKHQIWSQELSAAQSMAECTKKLIELQLAPNADIDVYSGDPLNFHYFRASFKEAVERRIPDERGRFIRLLKFTSGEAKDLIKDCIHLSEESCFTKAMDLLEKKFGDKERIINHYLDTLRSWPKINQNDAQAYEKLHCFLKKGLIYKQGGHLVELDSDTVMRTSILAKLDKKDQESWLRKVVRNKEKKGSKLVFSDLVLFVENLVELASNPSFSQQAYRDDLRNVEFKGGSYGINMRTVDTSIKDKNVDFLYCMVCGKEHRLEDCEDFKKMAVKERAHYLFHNKLCFNCLKDTGPVHLAQNCKEEVKCKLCNKSHNTLLHGYESKLMKVSNIHTANNANISMCILPLRVLHPNSDKEILTYALLDENSQGTFICNSLIDELVIETREALIQTQTINGTYSSIARAAEGLIVKPSEEFGAKYGHQNIKLPTTYSRDELLFHIDEVPTKDKLKDFDYLENVAANLPDFDSSLELGLIIGANCPKALEPQEIVPALGDGPYASRSHLGWRVIGPMQQKTDPVRTMSCFRIGVRVASLDISTNKPSSVNFNVSENTSDGIITEQLQKMYQHDFTDIDSEQISYSKEDLRFMNLMESQVKKVNGHYQLPLPFKNPHVHLKNNKDHALKRLVSVKRKMAKDPSYKQDYLAFMSSILEKGYATKSSSSPPGKTWYLPHFGTRHPTKNKLRVVFDCSISVRNQCLNQELMQGPDLTNMLLGVLLRFRLHKIPYMADIESMFYQVLVLPEQNSSLKFLWWPEGDLHREPEEYQMCVHLFGATSSPSCANFALRQTVVDELCQGSPEANTILHNFYVDDLLKSNDFPGSAIKNIAETQQLCASGGFNLTKFVCPDPEVASSIPTSKLSKETTKLINNEDCIGRALGVQWSLELDEFQFKICVKESPLTKRGILSVVSSIYDPFGIAGPFILQGKKVLQQISALKDGWDAPVPQELAHQWIKWRENIPLLQNITLARCYKPKEFGTITDQSLHMFSDASEVGYSVASYLRQKDEHGNICVSLVMGKSRVSPLKLVTIPRLELTAAALAVNIGSLLKKELQMPDISDYYWTDSKISLGYIFNETKRFRVFVANRAQKIRAYTDCQQWNYIDTKENPADHGSRGISVKDQKKVEQWLKGPQILYGRDELWLNGSTLSQIPEVPEADVEIKKVVTVYATKVIESLLDSFEKYSSWRKILRILATMLKFADRCRSSKSSVRITVADMRRAEIAIVRLVQQTYLAKEISICLKAKSVPNPKTQRRQSQLRQLDPWLDHNQILRVGGRLNKLFLSEEETNPIIMPKNCFITRRIAEYFHRETKHSGRTTTLNETRQRGFWLISANPLIRSIINECVTCKILRGRYS